MGFVQWFIVGADNTATKNLCDGRNRKVLKKKERIAIIW
jgi:hypothetical protein